MKHGGMTHRRVFYIWMMKVLMWISAGLTTLLVLFLIGYVFIKGLPNISFELLTTSPSYLADRIGILPDILNTIYIVLATLLIVLPLGVGAAIYLTEYAANKKLVTVIEYAAETLSGIPSIIYGLVGMLFFCQFLNMKTSLLAGALTLVIMNLPTIMRTTQESLKTVPQSYREGAFGLGAGKWRVIRTVVLPGCIDGVITGCILSVGRILGESAALLFTAGFAHALNRYRKRTWQRRSYTDSSSLCICKGTGRIRSGICNCGDSYDSHHAYQFCGSTGWKVFQKEKGYVSDEQHYDGT